jgi:hypothetical protein
MRWVISKTFDQTNDSINPVAGERFTMSKTDGPQLGLNALLAAFFLGSIVGMLYARLLYR